jgi:hypothetical protein
MNEDFLTNLDTCECGKKGKLEPALIEALKALRIRMDEGLTVSRCFICSECLHRYPGYEDSGHDKGTDVDLAVYGQYYRHKALKHVAYLFPVIVLTPRMFHLSVRKDWPQPFCQIA